MASVTSLKDLHESHYAKCTPVEKRFPAMGSEAMISIITNDRAAAQVTIARIHRAVVTFENQFSRFLQDSELSQLNHAQGVFHASKPMIDLLVAACAWHVKTGGIFDPTVIDALETLGYDTSIDFSPGPAHKDTAPDIAEFTRRFTTRAPFASLIIDADARIVHMPTGLRIDLGGIGKGYIVDACADMIAQTHSDFWLSAGGDVCVSGTNCDEPWRVGVQDPFSPADDIGCITIEPGTRQALATSGIIKRKGKAGEVAWHHIIDPRTGMPARNDIVAVTVLAPTATAADILAKTILILGKEKGIEHISRYPDTGCCIIDTNKQIILSDSLKHHFTPQQ